MSGEKLFREVFNELAEIAAMPTLEERPLGVNPVFDLMSEGEYAAFWAASPADQGDLLRAACEKYGIEWFDCPTAPPVRRI